MGDCKVAHLGGLMDKATDKRCRCRRGVRRMSAFPNWNLELTRRGRRGIRMWDISECETCNVQEEAVLARTHCAVRPSAYRTAVGKHMPQYSDCQESPKAERKVWPHHLHISQPQLTIRKQSSPSSGKSVDENMTTLWMTLTCTWPFGAYFWIPLFKQQFILDRTEASYDSWRIIFGTVWNSYSMKLENWSVDKQKSLV